MLEDLFRFVKILLLILIIAVVIYAAYWVSIFLALFVLGVVFFTFFGRDKDE